MTVERIEALIKKYIAEYTDEVHKQYQQASTSDTVADHDFHKWLADMATGQVAALGRLQYAIEHPEVEV